MRRTARRCATTFAAVAAVTVSTWSVVPSIPAAGALEPVLFSYSGETQNYDVPDNGSVGFVAIATAGANGGDAALLDGTVIASGGAGGSVFAAFVVTPGDTISVDVGGRGDDGGQTPAGSSGGFGGGGAGGDGTQSGQG